MSSSTLYPDYLFESESEVGNRLSFFSAIHIDQPDKLLLGRVISQEVATSLMLGEKSQMQRVFVVR